MLVISVCGGGECVFVMRVMCACEVVYAGECGLFLPPSV